MITEKQKHFIELWANKDKLGLTAEQVASEVCVSKKTLYNWLKLKEIQEEINKLAVANLDAVIPKLASQTEKLINSNKSSDIKLGMESFFKIKEQLEAKESLNSRSIEMEKFRNGAELVLKVFTESMGLDEIGQKCILSTFAGYVVAELRKKPNEALTEKEINRFLQDHEG